MTYQLQIDDRDPYVYSIGYFDPKMKNKPASLAFRVVDTVRKIEVTLQGVVAIAQEIAREDYRYRF